MYADQINAPIEVEVTSLDAFVSDHQVSQIDLLKIDVQGAEVLVLRGGVYALKYTETIVLEASFYDYYENHTSIYEIEEILLPQGFQLYSISEISQNPMNGRTDWAEMLYVKTSR